MEAFLRTWMVFLFLLICGISIAQGEIIVNETPPIDAMMRKFVEQNELHPEISGWRIQLLATTDRQKVEGEKQRFQTFYPNIAVDWTHSKPYYKLRAGAFSSRLETYRMLSIIRRDYPGAYPAMDNLMPFELLY